MKLYRYILIFLVFITCVPFLYFLSTFNYALLDKSSTLFWQDTDLVIGSVLGFIGTVMLFWQFILGTRQISGLFTKDINWVNKFHRYLGEYGLLVVFAHPIFMMFSYLEGIDWIFIPHFENSSEFSITYGRIGFWLFVIVFITSAFLREKIKYRPWKYIHYIVYPTLVLVFFHAITYGTFFRQYFFLQVIWYTMMYLFGMMVLFRIANGFGIFSKDAEIEAIKKLGNDTLVVTLKILGNFPKIVPGQYMYFQLRAFGETHPFTVMEYDEKDKKLIFGIKIEGRFTRKVSGQNAGTKLKLDGPYGIFTEEGQNEKPKVIMAGGIGMTPFIELIKQYGNKDTYVFFSLKEGSGNVMNQSLINKTKIKYFEFISYGDNKTVRKAAIRMDEVQLLKTLKKEKLNNYNYFICGSKRYNKGMTKMLKDNGVKGDQIFMEKFY